MEKTVNLEEVLKSSRNSESINIEHYISPDGYVWKMILSSMKEACRQSIELCAENVISETIKSDYKADIHTNQINSILNTINQIK